MKVLHFLCHGKMNVRAQRFLQSNINMGHSPVLFVNSEVQNDLWIPNKSKIPVEFYKYNRRWFYTVPPYTDYLGLKKVFDKHGCDFVHAHELWTAYYSYSLGLPTIFDDWEYFLEYLRFVRWDSNPKGWLADLIKKGRAKGMTEKLIKNVPVIVTNKNAEKEYQLMGAEKTAVVPNVPLKYERDYAFKSDSKKCETITTAYVGDINDENWILRDMRGVKDLWQQHNLGDLYVFSGKNYCMHLDVLRKLRECHFNLLYWKPFDFHKHYLQNKAFLASVVGVPTIISSSLTATIDLLGEYAITVNKLTEIPEAMKTYSFPKLKPAPEHLWEHYEPAIKEMYEGML
jgi:hypothetical protein